MPLSLETFPETAGSARNSANLTWPGGADTKRSSFLGPSVRMMAIPQGGVSARSAHGSKRRRGASERFAKRRGTIRAKTRLRSTDNGEETGPGTASPHEDWENANFLRACWQQREFASMGGGAN